MARTSSEKAFFYTGPLIVSASFFFLVQGYRAFWAAVSPTSSPGMAGILAFLTFVAIFCLARYFEKLAASSLKSRNWMTALLSGVVGLALLFLSAIGVANALYYSWAGRDVLEGGLAKISGSYELIVAETSSISATPTLDKINAQVKGPIDTLKSEIQSVNCGIGTGANAALGSLETILGSTFHRMNFSGRRVPACSDSAGLRRMAEDYEQNIRNQVLAVPTVIAERVLERQALADFASSHYSDFRKRSAALLLKIDEEAHAVKIFATGNAYNGAIRDLISLADTLQLDRVGAIDKASRLGATYSKDALAPVDIDQEKSLGGLRSLYLAVRNFNPWYVLLFAAFAAALDIVLVVWFHFTRTHIFPDPEARYVEVEGKRVKYLWASPSS